MKRSILGGVTAILFWGSSITGYAAPALSMTQPTSYQCMNKKHVTVQYAFDRNGQPVHARFIVKGKPHIVRYNKSQSDSAYTLFGQEGQYMLSTGAITRAQYRSQSIMITAPTNEIVFKDCTTKR